MIQSALPQVGWINSVEELRSAAADWDDLWQRSDVAAPTARAELVAQWVEAFAPRSGFRAAVVRDQGKLVAALPLVRKRLYRVLSAAMIPANAWLPTGGGLLVDADRATDQVMGLLVGTIAELPQQVVWLDEVALGVPRWQAFWKAVGRAGMPLSIQERYPVGVIGIDHDWEAYRESWSRRHRRKLGWAFRQLTDRGELNFTIRSQIPPDDMETQLRRGFEIENRSWKGSAGSSVFARGVFPYFVRQAKQLAVWGQLRLAFLTLEDRPIAFCYGFAAKGVFHPLKIAYDPEFGEFSPGMVMFHGLLEQLFHDPEYCAVDTVGLLTDTLAHWRPRPYMVGIAMIAPRRAFGRLATFGHQHWWPTLRRLKTRLQRKNPSP
ncbi:MAG: GNAT family N-acetyltransferase [Pirellulales bacterium]|nr:GNAT family N-acetyltransferase [Pirellulales bacterium]